MADGGRGFEVGEFLEQRGDLFLPTVEDEPGVLAFLEGQMGPRGIDFDEDVKEVQYAKLA